MRSLYFPYLSLFINKPLALAKTGRAISFISKAQICKHKFFLVFFIACTLASANLHAQTITAYESRCENNGKIIINGTIGTGGPYQLSVISYPSEYTPGPVHNRQNLPDTFSALFPGLYTIKVVDAAETNFTYPGINVTGNYIKLVNSDYLPFSSPVTNCALPDGKIQGIMTNGRAPYSYTVISGPAQQGATNATGTFVGLPSGDYTVQSMDSCQNIQTRDVTIAGYPSLFAIDSAHVSIVNCTTYSLDSLWTNPPLPGSVYYDIINYDNTGGSVVRATSNTLPVNFTLFAKTDVLNGRVKIKVYNDCGNAAFFTPVKYTNFRASDTVINGIINMIACDSFAFESINTPSLFPPGGMVRLVNSRTGDVYNTTLPIRFKALKGDIISGNIIITFWDSCNIPVSTNRIRTINNEWGFVQDVSINCDGSVIVNNIVFSGFMLPPVIIKVKAFFRNPGGFADSTAEQIITSFPYTVTGITGNPNPISIRLEVTDGCGEIQRKTISRSFIASAGNYRFVDCNITGIEASVLGLFNLPITYSVSPQAGTVPNTNGYFELPQGTYIITATDSCGKVARTVINLNRLWQLKPIKQGKSCVTGYVTDTLEVPKKSVGPLTIKLYAGAMPVNASSLLLNTRVFFSSRNNCLSCADNDTTAERIVFDSILPGRAYSYVVTDSCGNADTISIVNGTGKQPFYHNSFSKTKCANGSNIYANWYNDGDISNHVIVTLFDSAHNQLLGFNGGSNTNLNTYPNGQVLWPNAGTAMYTVEYSFTKCPQVFVDTVFVKEYVQPKVISVKSFAPCTTGEPVIITASDGVPPYTYEIVNTSPGNYTFAPQPSPVFTLPVSQSTATVRVLDSCLNSAILTVAITRSAQPVIRSNPSLLTTCVLPFNIMLFTDSVYDGCTFKWQKLTGTGSGPAVISNRPSLNVLYYSIEDTGTYKVNVAIPGTCFDTSAIFALNNVATNCTGLPVTIVNFTATPNASDVKLNWVVAEQINISDYTVEWSTDGRHFQPVGILPATNTSSYIMLHKKPATGLNYYRLKILENDGRVSYSRVAAVHFNFSSGIIIKPNPFKSTIDVVMELQKKSPVAISLYDMGGRKVYQNIFGGSIGRNVFSLSKLDKISNGVYIVNVTGDGFVMRSKVIKD